MTHSLASVVRDDFSAPFFDATAEGRLLLRFSPGSGEWSDPAARFCVVSQADDLEWREASGRGVVRTWTVKPGRATEDRPAVPTVLVVVETEEGPWLPLQVPALQVPDADLSALRTGVAVRIGFVQPEGSEFLPVAELVECVS